MRVAAEDFKLQTRMHRLTKLLLALSLQRLAYNVSLGMLLTEKDSQPKLHNFRDYVSKTLRYLRCDSRTQRVLILLVPTHQATQEYYIWIKKLKI